MRKRSQEWGKQAASIRKYLALQPVCVGADGACGLSSLSVAAGGTASHDEKESLRTEVLSAAPQFLRDVSFQKLLLLLEGESAHLEASAALKTSQLPASAVAGATGAAPDAPQVADAGATGAAPEAPQVADAGATVKKEIPSQLANGTVARIGPAPKPAKAADRQTARKSTCCLDQSQAESVLGSTACEGDTTAESGGRAPTSTQLPPVSSQVTASPAVASDKSAEAARASAAECPRPEYPWRGGCKRAPRETGDGGAKAQSPIRKQPRSGSRSRSPSR